MDSSDRFLEDSDTQANSLVALVQMPIFYLGLRCYCLWHIQQYPIDQKKKKKTENEELALHGLVCVLNRGSQ